MARTGEDRFTNIVSATVTMSAANTATYTEIVTGVSLGTGVGLLIDHIDYSFTSATIKDMDTDGDLVQAQWSTSETGAFDYASSTTLDVFNYLRTDAGTAANAYFHEMPFQRYYSPAIVLAAPRLYLGMASTGLTIAGEVTSRLYFRYIPLSDKEYLELAETFVLVG